MSTAAGRKYAKGKGVIGYLKLYGHVSAASLAKVFHFNTVNECETFLKDLDGVHKSTKGKNVGLWYYGKEEDARSAAYTHGFSRWPR